jgi:hypothetical protein
LGREESLRVIIEGMAVPFSLTILGFGYKRLFRKTMAGREKGSTGLDMRGESWRGGGYDYRSTERD